MADFAQSVAAPPTGAYAPTLLNFAPLANLPNDYAQAQKNAFDEQQRQRTTQLQQPIDVSDPKSMALQLAARDPGMAAQLLPFLLGQEPGQVSPLLGGTPAQAPGGPQAGAGGPSGQPAPTLPQGGVTARTVARPPGKRFPQGDAGTGTVMDIAIAAGLPENDQKTGAVVGNIAKSLKVDPNAPLTPQQQVQAAQRVQAYAQRNGIQVAAPGDQGGGGADGATVQPGSRVLHPQPAPAQPAPQPQRQTQQPAVAPIPGLILPPQFKPGQEMEAAQALLQAGAQAIASNNPKTRAEGELMLNRAAEIEKRMAPKIVGGNLIGPRGEVVYSATAGAAEDIAGAIEDGTQPPVLTGLARSVLPQVRQIMAKDGFNLAKAQQEWAGAQKQIQSLNGPQMVRYAGLASSVLTRSMRSRRSPKRWATAAFRCSTRSSSLPISKPKATVPTGNSPPNTWRRPIRSRKSSPTWPKADMRRPRPRGIWQISRSMAITA